MEKIILTQHALFKPKRLRLQHRAIGLSILLLLIFSSLQAQNIYIWEDENGIQHFSDRKPDYEAELTVQRALAEPESPMAMQNLGTNSEPKWVFTNRLYGPLSIEVQLTDAVNTVSEPSLPNRFTLAANSQEEPVLIGPLDSSQAWSYRIGSSAVPGDLNAEHDLDYQYQLPLEQDQPYRISQGFNGSFSHNLPHSRYAIDIELPIGTPLHAARAGRVMDLARYFHQAGQDIDRFAMRANFIRLLHDDGSMAVYAHLNYNGILVRPGQRVQKGQKIGLSGNTGYSTGPHLHFSVQVNQDMSLVSVPFKMQNHLGETLPETAITR